MISNASFMMPNSGVRSLLLAGAVVLSLVSAALGHGHEDDGGAETGRIMDHVEIDQPSTSNLENMGLPSYFRHEPYTPVMLAHIVVMSVSWIFVLPLCVMFSIARSRMSLSVHFLFVALNSLGVVLAIVYNSNTPDLYPNNSHRTLGWVLTVTACAQACMAYIRARTDRTKVVRNVDERAAFIAISKQAMEEHQRVQSLAASQNHRFSDDSGQGTERNTESLISPSRSSMCEVVNDRFANTNLEDDSEHDAAEKQGLINPGNLDKFLTISSKSLLFSRSAVILGFFHDGLNRVILIIGFVGLTTGIVTYAGIFRGNEIFSGLAHFIKGAVFFWYGILSIGRWTGCFADLGWAWNVKPPERLVGSRVASAPSAEFVESFLIFFYGSTNIFLEHLGSWGQGWDAQDLEHISITVMFIGGGLCGMLIESRGVGGLLNATILQAPAVRTLMTYEEGRENDRLWQAPKSYPFSMNPLPALVVLLLGLMMSSHHQSSMVSTMLHKQWGVLLVGSAFARAVTYLLFYLSPPTSILPSRPPSELITSFCLMGGGLIFMASSADTVNAMEYNNLDAMFVFTIAMGLVTFTMAWIIVVLAAKGWAVKRNRVPSLKRHIP